jgi:hypothetical protein
MCKWRLLVAGCSLALLGWGVVALVEYGRSLHGAADPYDHWVFSGLGLVGLATLLWPRLGYVAAAAQLAAAAYAAWVCVLAFAISQTAAVTNLYLIGPILLAIASLLLVLCGANAVGTWQVARLAGRCT